MVSNGHARQRQGLCATIQHKTSIQIPVERLQPSFVLDEPPELFHLTAAIACELTASDISNSKANLIIRCFSYSTDCILTHQQSFHIVRLLDRHITFQS